LSLRFVVALVFHICVFALKKLFLKQRLRELFGVERLQVVRLLAEADEFDGQA